MCRFEYMKSFCLQSRNVSQGRKRWRFLELNNIRVYLSKRTRQSAPINFMHLTNSHRETHTQKKHLRLRPSNRTLLHNL